MKSDTQATIIVIAAIVVSAPRWAVALLAAEGFALPAAWLGWWVVMSALLNATMAIVEGLAFSYTFTAWRNQTDQRAKWLGVLMGASALVFVGVIAPYIAANVRQEALRETLAAPWASLAWAVCVALSTILIVVSVGYAQKAGRAAVSKPTVAQVERAEPTPTPQEAHTTQAGAYICRTCGESYATSQALAGHSRRHTTVKRNGHAKERIKL